MELWKDIEGFEGVYQVSSYGNVRRIDGDVIKPKKFQVHVSGYHQVNLWKNGVCHPRRVNRLVAIAFIENPMMKPVVNHIDKDKLNNRVENLEWVTYKENSNHGTAIERARRTSHDNWLSKQPRVKVRKDNKWIEFKNAREVSKYLGVHEATVSRYLNGNGRKYNGWLVKYCDDSLNVPQLFRTLHVVDRDNKSYEFHSNEDCAKFFGIGKNRVSEIISGVRTNKKIKTIEVIMKGVE